MRRRGNAGHSTGSDIRRFTAPARAGFAPGPKLFSYTRRFCHAAQMPGRTLPRDNAPRHCRAGPEGCRRTYNEFHRPTGRKVTRQALVHCCKATLSLADARHPTAKATLCAGKATLFACKVTISASQTRKIPHLCQMCQLPRRRRCPAARVHSFAGAGIAAGGAGSHIPDQTGRHFRSARTTD